MEVMHGTTSTYKLKYMIWKRQDFPNVKIKLIVIIILRIF
jgi:hypothetical protein